MTHALEVQQAFRDLEVQAQVHAKTLETLKARVLSRFAVADHARDAGSVSGGRQDRGPRRDEYVRRLQGDLAAARTELADALGALEQERAARQIYQREFSHAMREVERLKASEAASAERERKLTDALRVGGARCAAAERARKVLVDQVAALHGWNPSDAAVKVMLDRLVFGDGDRSAVRAGLRAAFVHDHLEVGEPRT